MWKGLSNRRFLQVLAFAVVIVISSQILKTHLNNTSLLKANKHETRHDNVSNCSAIDWSNPRFCIPSSNSPPICGSPFNISSNLLRDIGLPLRNFEVLQRSNLHDIVFVTAADETYFHVAMDAIANVQRHFPNQSIYFYDLNNDSLPNVTSKIESLCNVFYRKFNFSRYPSHMGYLKNYAFKPVLVHEMLTEFPRLFWMDSSVRFNTGNLALTLDEVYASGGILTFEYSGHSNFAATHSRMYRYLPISASHAISTIQYGANGIYIHRNEILYNRVIAWWVLCALDSDCIAPTLKLKCNYQGNAIWGDCHRFDQSALNILMAHLFKYDVSKYTSHHGQLEIRRYLAHQGHLVVCPNGTSIKSADYFS